MLKTIAEVRHALDPVRREGRRIGFVPTMGALHSGHWSLVDRAGQACDQVVVSIFVNPLQFAPQEDLDAYPRPIERDLAGCRKHGCDLVFIPTPREMYPDHTLTRVNVRQLCDPLCGRARPGHFEGVATVVYKLFNIVLPDVAFFGEKDYQQLAIIRRMVRDLNLPTEIIACPTVRESDGLAISSRNAYLDSAQRSAAASISAALRAAVDAVAGGERDTRRLCAAAKRQIADAGADPVEYVEVVDAETLMAMPVLDRPARMCVAARFGSARLIDNVALDAEDAAK